MLPPLRREIPVSIVSEIIGPTHPVIQDVKTQDQKTTTLQHSSVKHQVSVTKQQVM